MTGLRQPRDDCVVRPLPSALLEDCTTYLEEQLYNQGLATLSSALLSGFSNASPIFVPPPQHLALAATLSVHPNFTTRTHQSDKQKAAQAALAYLRHVHKFTNVESAGFARAFVFDGSASSGRDQRARLRRSAARQLESSNEGEDQFVEERQIHNSYAQELSLFKNADDIWAVIGWCFNCSMKHPHRWQVWKPWLQMMLDLMEDEVRRRKDAVDDEAGFQSALIYRYMSGPGGRLINLRRVMRAIFADGSTQSVAEFPEIWRNETRLPKKESLGISQKRKELDIENDEFADYLDAGSDAESFTGDPNRLATDTFLAEESENEEARTINGRKSTSTATSVKDTAWQDGADPTIGLRLRLLAIISELSFGAPKLFMEPYDFASLVGELVRPLPIGSFMQFTLPLKSNFSIDMQVTISEVLLKSLVAGDTPTDTSWTMTQDTFEKWYAPRSASNASASDNAKVSVLVESVLRNLWQADCLQTENRASLTRAIGKGITAREQKIGSARSKMGKKQETDGPARLMLENSAKRLQTFLATLSKL